MGTGASSTSVGVPQNPRVQYSKQLEKKEKKKVLVDAPVLVDVEHGSVRYRQSESISHERKQLKEKECPYENEHGQDLQNKDHYFYHTRLKKYGSESSRENEDAFKFYYVLKGPAAAKQKKMFYVYGQGWGARDGLRVKPSETVGHGKDFAWSSQVQPNALYYKLEFDDSGQDMCTEAEDKLLADLESTPDKTNIRLSIRSDERVLQLKARVAIKLLKSTKDIHIAHDNKELRDEDVVFDFRPTQDAPQSSEPVENVNVILRLI